MTIGKSSEALKGEPAPESVFQHGNVFGVKGKKFQAEFMANYVLPLRRDIATMVLGSVHQHSGYVSGADAIEEVTDYAFDVADAFIRSEFSTLDIEAYFELYMNGPASRDMGEILAAAVDRAQGYSL